MAVLVVFGRLTAVLVVFGRLTAVPAISRQLIAVPIHFMLKALMPTAPAPSSQQTIRPNPAMARNARSPTSAPDPLPRPRRAEPPEVEPSYTEQFVATDQLLRTSLAKT
jgi:hypothetical protein